jgi:hypothetical protein
MCWWRWPSYSSCEARRRILKRVAIFQIRSARFRLLILRMSLSRNRFPLSGDML